MSAEMEAKLTLVEALMGRLAQGEGFSRMGQIVGEQVSTGGKRLRARLALSTYFALGEQDDRVVGWAAACELLHNATLVHDDIQDGDKVRRGRPTIWVSHGVAQAINAGDLMLMLPFSAIDEIEASDELKWKLSRKLALTAQEIVRGQSFEPDLFDLVDAEDGFEKYVDCVRAKTAVLFRLAAEGSAELAGLVGDEIAEIGRVFESLGILFQIQDDVVDLYGNKGRNQAGRDLQEGKVSCLVVELLRQSPEEGRKLLAKLRNGGKGVSIEDIEKISRLFVETGALGSCLDRIEKIVGTVRSAHVLDRDSRLRGLSEKVMSSMVAPIGPVFVSQNRQLELTP